MLTKEFVQGIFERRPNVGLPLVLVFNRAANVQRAMVTLLILETNAVLTIDSYHRLSRQVGCDSDDGNRIV